MDGSQLVRLPFLFEEHMRPIHPTVQLLLWILLVLLAQRWQLVPLLVMCVLCGGTALWVGSVQFLGLLRRTRWIAFSLLLIYAYATPGTALWNSLGSFSPTYEGMLDGALQLGRLLCALSGLAILLTSLSQERLISGLYSLAYPLRFFGLSRERFAVRLALTLEYAETAMRDTASDWRSTIDHALQTGETGTAHIELQRQRYGLLDALLLIAGVALMIGVWR
jgi:energy-coupling factor transport system permease protein